MGADQLASRTATALTALGVTAVATVLALLDVRSTWFEKEGLVEQVSHVVLVVAVVLWLKAFARERRWGTVVVALFTAFVLLEEIDWGGVYGLASPTFWGDRNMHNAWSGHSYVLFGLPLIILYSVPRIAKRASARALGRSAPGGLESVAFALLVATSLGLTLAFPANEDELDEVFELGVYILLLGPPLSFRAT